MELQYKTYGSYENEYGQDYVYPNERMYVHSSVFLPSSEIDPRTGFLKPDQPRRGRTQAMRMEYNYLDQEYQQLDEALRKRMEQPGLRMSLRSAILLVAVVAFVFAVLLLWQQGDLAQRQKALNRLTIEIQERSKTNSELTAKIIEASDQATICYIAARDLEMIPAEAANPIHLIAMDTRPMEADSSGVVLTADDSAIREDSTAILTIASAGAGY